MKRVAEKNNIIAKIKRDLSNFRGMFNSSYVISENDVAELGDDLNNSLNRLADYARRFENSTGVASERTNNPNVKKLKTSRNKENPILSHAKEPKTKDFERGN